MKTKIYTLALAAIIAVTSVTSCSDSFLDEKLTTQHSTDYFKTQEGLDDLVTGAYQKLKFKFNYTWGICMFNLGVDEFSDANNPIPSFNCYSADLNSNEVTTASANIASFWDNMYGGIESANTIIQNMPQYYDQSNANYNTRLGEGYFLRGYFYLSLITQYGGVPLKLDPSTGVETYFTRNSEDECFAQVISDLEQAYSLLPGKAEAPGRITKWAAAHYLAKTHLTRASELYSAWNSPYVSADLDKVIRYGSEVVDAHPLSNDYVNLWDYRSANYFPTQI